MRLQLGLLGFQPILKAGGAGFFSANMEIKSDNAPATFLLGPSIHFRSFIVNAQKALCPLAGGR